MKSTSINLDLIYGLYAGAVKLRGHIIIAQPAFGVIRKCLIMFYLGAEDVIQGHVLALRQSQICFIGSKDIFRHQAIKEFRFLYQGTMFFLEQCFYLSGAGIAARSFKAETVHIIDGGTIKVY